MSIKWGEVDFDGPYAITKWDPPYRAGVYAIMIQQDPKNEPNTYTIIYFGVSGNMNERGFYKAHHKYDCWSKKAGSDDNIFIGVYLMSNSTPEQRKDVESKLISQYKPSCND